MAKRKRVVPKRWSWSMIGGSTLIVAAIVIGTFFMSAKHSLAPTVTTTTDPSAITITTADGVILAATMRSPVRNSLSPAVILLHEYGQDRHQWDPYLQKFLDAGIAVLSYDMRGFGASRLAAIPSSTDEHLGSLPKDVVAVMAYLRQQPTIDQQRINIIGASIGANVAYVASGSGLGLHRAVLVSPSLPGTALDGHDVANFAPSGILGITNQAEEKNLQAVMSNVQEPRQTQIVTGGHGIELLSVDTVLPSIIQWITQ